MSTIKSRILKRLQSRKKTNVFLRADFADLGSSSQVSYLLRELINEGKLVKISYGIYTRSRKSSLSGKPVPKENLISLAFEALKKLGYDPQLSQAAKEYAEGKTTQIPARLKVNIGKAKISRTISFGNSTVGYERSKQIKG